MVLNSYHQKPFKNVDLNNPFSKKKKKTFTRTTDYEEKVLECGLNVNTQVF